MKKMRIEEKTSLIVKALRVFAGVLGLAALFIPFAIGLKTVVQSDYGPVITNYGPAFAFLFGGKISTGKLTYNTLGISVPGVIAYVFLVLGVILSLLTLALKNKTAVKCMVLLSAVASLVSAIVMICAHDSAATVLADAIMGKHSESVAVTMIKNARLEFGFWGVSLFCFINTTALMSSLIFDGTVDELKAKIMGH